MRRLVLIADQQKRRRGRLAHALRGSGADVEQVGNGPAALELALSRRPALVVAACDLPLVDASKLAEILRANPRTCAARFVFVGDAARFVDHTGPSDVLLQADTAIEDIAATVEAELETESRLSDLMSALEREEWPSGSFPELPLLEVMHCLHVWKRSGRLDLRREGAAEGQGRASLWLSDGELVEAALGETRGRKALYRLLEWERGDFKLLELDSGEPGASSDPGARDVSDVNRSPLAPLRSLLNEGMRQRAESARLSARLPSPDGQVRLRVRAAELPNILHPLTQEVLSLLEVHGSVREVVDRSSYPDYQVLRTLSTLADRQIIQLSKDRAREGVDNALFDDHQVRRLSEWALSEPVRSQGANLKLLVAASCPSALADFTALLRVVPSASLAADFDADSNPAALAEDQFATLGRLEIAAGLGIDLVHVPIRKEMAPLWPVAGAGALGTLFLLSGSVGEAASRVQPMADALRCLPRSRIFNLLLFHKGEPLSTSELGENLCLIDEASLFMVPLESGKAPLALLRSVFSRVVP